jgi:tetratricopeptide (TPR) repeat protein
MPIDLVVAILGWLVQVSGDSAIRLVRGSPDERALKRAMRMAIEVVVAQANPQSRALEQGLRLCFSSSPLLRLDAPASVGEGLRAAIAAQLSILDRSVNNDTGRPFYEEVGVEPDWLTEKVTEAIIGALHQVVAAGGLADLVHVLDAADISGRLDILGMQISGLSVSSPAAVTRTLPHDIATFTGREIELARLMHALTDTARRGRVVGIHAIDGMGGVGKTTFAVHAAHKLAPGFPDGQLFVRLHAHTPGQQPIDPFDALGTLLLNNGLAAAQIPADLDARIALWRDRMADMKVLLLLDDAVGHEQVRPLLPESADSLVLITSRRRLVALDDAVSISLDTLSPDDAAELFVRLVGRAGLHPTDGAVAKVIRLCGYLPLAIRLMAGRAATHSAWTLGDLVGDLTAAENRLALMRAENLSVAAAFDLSYRGLTIAQQQLFRRLGLHPGPDLDAYAAAALDGSDLITARQHLDDLYDQHLIDEPAHGRFRFHDLIREHARNLASSDQPAQNEAAADRLLNYYLRTANVADRVFRETRASDPPEKADLQVATTPRLPTYQSALAWLENERLNLAAAIDYAAARGQSHIAAQLSHTISLFARRRGYWDQTLTLHEAALTCARTAGDPSDQASILNDLAVLRSQKGDYVTSTVELAEALGLYADLNDQAGQADILANLGVVQYLTGDHTTAIATLTQALDLCHSLRDQARQADVLAALAEVQAESGDHPAATVTWEQALGLYRDLGGRRGEANALLGIGFVQWGKGDPAAAAASFNQALGLFRDLDDPRGEATVLIDIGIIQLNRKEYAAATANWEKALSMFRKLGSPLGQAKALGNLGMAKYQSGDVPAAVASLTEALALHRRIGDRAGETETLNLLADIQSELEGLAGRA